MKEIDNYTIYNSYGQVSIYYKHKKNNNVIVRSSLKERKNKERSVKKHVMQNNKGQNNNTNKDRKRKRSRKFSLLISRDLKKQISRAA